MRSSSRISATLIASVALFGLFETSWTLGADNRAEPDRAAEVDRLFAKWDQLDTPGGAVAIVRGGELNYAKGFGTADLETGVPNTSQTVFEIGSASKSFTCACIALLMDQGKLQPDDDLADFVPELRKFDPPVRIRHMVQCRTGLWEPFHIMPLAGWDNLPVHSPYSEADLLTVLSGQKTLPFEPGAQFHYASGDYYFLVLIVKRVTGKFLAEFARENLFEPLGQCRSRDLNPDDRLRSLGPEAKNRDCVRISTALGLDRKSLHFHTLQQFSTDIASRQHSSRVANSAP